MDDPGERGKREGMKRSYDAANEEWKRATSISVIEVAKDQPTFNTDDVEAYQREHYPNVYTREKRAMGGIMANAFRAGVCIPTGEYTPSLRAVAHKGPKRTWISQIYRGQIIPVPIKHERLLDLLNRYSTRWGYKFK